MILGIDTSTDMTGIALYRRDKGVVAELTWLSRREQTTQLLPAISSLMTQVNVVPTELTGLAVATGPGSFSGVRIGLSTAKSLAHALSVPVWGVPTLDALAFMHAAVTAARVCAVLQLGRGRLAWALYRTRGAQWQRLSEYESGTGEEMSDYIMRASEGASNALPVLFCGELDEAARASLITRLGTMALIAPGAASLRRASFLVELALQREAKCEADDPATLQAIYLQPA